MDEMRQLVRILVKVRRQCTAQQLVSCEAVCLCATSCLDLPEVFAQLGKWHSLCLSLQSAPHCSLSSSQHMSPC